MTLPKQCLRCRAFLPLQREESLCLKCISQKRISEPKKEEVKTEETVISVHQRDLTNVEQRKKCLWCGTPTRTAVAFSEEKELCDRCYEPFYQCFLSFMARRLYLKKTDLSQVKKSLKELLVEDVMYLVDRSIRNVW